ncbi:hypothetical protein ACJIZ3_006166 [Penstemon smallii]|uniref:Uncharacterized protein n=1 Tax=Penstemon smallii TaxID=265156 RepID=A0ABD3S733_9LAMI
MGGPVLYPHYVLHLPSISAFYGSRPKFGNPIFSFNETENYRLPFVSSIRANRDRSEKPPKNSSSKGEKGGNDNGKSSASSSKEEILALFKRIQSSISKGDTINSKKRSLTENEGKKPSAESLLEVLRQSRTRGKG